MHGLGGGFSTNSVVIQEVLLFLKVSEMLPWWLQVSFTFRMQKHFEKEKNKKEKNRFIPIVIVRGGFQRHRFGNGWRYHMKHLFVQRIGNIKYITLHLYTVDYFRLKKRVARSVDFCLGPLLLIVVVFQLSLNQIQCIGLFQKDPKLAK